MESFEFDETAKIKVFFRKGHTKKLCSQEVDWPVTLPLSSSMFLKYGAKFGIKHRVARWEYVV